jgi:hypothetical protein
LQSKLQSYEVRDPTAVTQLLGRFEDYLGLFRLDNLEIAIGRNFGRTLIYLFLKFNFALNRLLNSVSGDFTQLLQIDVGRAALRLSQSLQAHKRGFRLDAAHAILTS